MRESVDVKGRRYLVEGRLLIGQLDGLSIEASCRGGGAVYELGHNGAAWWCSCPALGRCAHLVALQLVTVRDAGEVDDDPEPVVGGLTSTGAAFEDDESPEPEVSL